MKKAVIYARVSTRTQSDKGISIGSQIEKLRDYAEKNDYEIVDQYIDDGISGRVAAKRPAFMSMIIDSARDQFKVVLIYDLSRFARDQVETIFYRKELEKNGVQLVSMLEPSLDAQTPEGEMVSALMVSFMSAFNEFEVKKTAHITKRGRDALLTEGFWPYGTIPIGYRAEYTHNEKGKKRKRFIIDPNYARTVSQILDLCISGLGDKKIAQKLNEEGSRRKNGSPWSKRNIETITRQKAYSGNLYYPDGSLACKDSHEAIKPESELQKIWQRRELIKTRQIEPATLSSSFILSRYTRCQCGSSVVGSSGTGKSGKVHQYYFCNRKMKDSPDSCDTVRIRKSDLESVVFDSIEKYIMTDDNITRLISMIQDHLVAKSERALKYRTEALKNMAQISQKIEKLWQLIESGEGGSALLRRIEKHESEKEKLQKTINSDHGLQLPDEKKLKNMIIHFKTHVAENLINSHAFLSEFVDHIILYKEKIQINYRFLPSEVFTDRALRRYITAPAVNTFRACLIIDFSGRLISHKVA